ncbi:MAG: ROK family protein [Anaerolineales bacterium]|nr:ROK family protein [Anaerolineales bacterium]
MKILGIDIGGSGIKGAPVNTKKGEMLTERYRIETPQPASPQPVADTVAEIARHFDWQGPIGCGFPAAIQHGVVRTASNIDDAWIEINAAQLFSQTTNSLVNVINDADAAGLAEMSFGAGRGRNGVVLLITLGTGLGTSVFTDGVLLPNTELGHIEIRGKAAEKRASDAIRQEKQLSWAKWAKRLDEYLITMEKLLWPDLIILGGGISKHHAKFLPHITVKTEVVPAQLRNEAGIIGAALAAQSKTRGAQSK